ncbi:hypothetical protein ACFQ0B_28775 [Nonomuraea thailandensis]
MRTLGRHLTTFGPFLTGAIAGGALNRMATKKLGEAIRNDLRVKRPSLPQDPGRDELAPRRQSGPPGRAGLRRPW